MSEDILSRVQQIEERWKEATPLLAVYKDFPLLLQTAYDLMDEVAYWRSRCTLLEGTLEEVAPEELRKALGG